MRTGLSHKTFKPKLKNVPISEDGDVCYDVKLLYVNISIKDTRFYSWKKLKLISEKSIFKKLPYKHTTDWTIVLPENFEKNYMAYLWKAYSQ